MDQILTLISAGESETVEFKREMERAERLAREVAALANGQGGYVPLGVAHDGTLCGVSFRPGYEA